MKNIVRRALRALVRYLAPHVGLGTFDCELSKPDTSPEAIAFLSEEIETPREWLTVTIH
jgi:hypothetical protein